MSVCLCVCLCVCLSVFLASLIIYLEEGRMSTRNDCAAMLGGTANQLNFAAIKFRGLPISLHFALFNFAFRYLRTKMLIHKNACSSLVYGPIFKI